MKRLIYRITSSALRWGLRLWVWVGGETKKHKDALKAAGYKWAIKKVKWYFAGVPAGGFRQFDMDEIRERYGSQRVMTRSA